MRLSWRMSTTTPFSKVCPSRLTRATLSTRLRAKTAARNAASSNSGMPQRRKQDLIFNRTAGVVTLLPSTVRVRVTALPLAGVPAGTASA